MGYRFRKSINCGLGFRINISENGIGYSWGAPGYRVTHKANGGVRRTYSIPGTGWSYVEEDSKKNTNNNSIRPNSMEKYNLENSASYNVMNGKISDISSPENESLVKSIKKIKIKNFLTWVMFAFITCLSTMLSLIPIEWLGILLFFVITSVFFIISIILIDKRFVFLDYTIDEKTSDYIQKREDAFYELKSSGKLWSITRYENVSYSRVNAGCNVNMDRKCIKFEYKKLPI